MSCKAVRDIPSGIVDEAISLGSIIDGISESFQSPIEREDS
jgi:hypothetical protein